MHLSLNSFFPAVLGMVVVLTASVTFLSSRDRSGSGDRSIDTQQILEILAGATRHPGGGASPAYPRQGVFLFSSLPRDGLVPAACHLTGTIARRPLSGCAWSRWFCVTFPPILPADSLLRVNDGGSRPLAPHRELLPHWSESASPRNWF